MQVHIRQAIPKDKEEILKFLPRIWKKDYIQDCYDSWMKERNGRTLVATVDDKVVGLVHVYIENDYAWIEAIRVNPDYQNMGIGKHLTDTCLEYAKEKGARVARLSTASSNPISQKVVSDEGFKKIADFARPRMEPLKNDGGKAHIAKPSERDFAWYIIEASRNYMDTNGLYVTEWTSKPLTEEALDRFIIAGNVIISDEMDTVLLFNHCTKWEKDKASEICFVDGTENGIENVLKKFVSIVKENNRSSIYGFIPRIDYIASSCKRVGFEISDVDVLVFEKKL